MKRKRPIWTAASHKLMVVNFLPILYHNSLMLFFFLKFHSIFRYFCLQTQREMHTGPLQLRAGSQYTELMLCATMDIILYNFPVAILVLANENC